MVGSCSQKSRKSLKKSKLNDVRPIAFCRLGLRLNLEAITVGRVQSIASRSTKLLSSDS
jgi:hypothetical protein